MLAAEHVNNVSKAPVNCMHAIPAGGYNEDFRGKMRSVLYNLKDEKNQDFRGKVLRGEVSPTRICHMESHDMASEVLLTTLTEVYKQLIRTCHICCHDLAACLTLHSNTFNLPQHAAGYIAVRRSGRAVSAWQVWRLLLQCGPTTSLHQIGPSAKRTDSPQMLHLGQ